MNHELGVHRPVGAVRGRDEEPRRDRLQVDPRRRRRPDRRQAGLRQDLRRRHARRPALRRPRTRRRRFARFCSGSLAGTAHGFDRSIYFANEESSAQLDTSTARAGSPSRSSTNNGVGEAHGFPASDASPGRTRSSSADTGNLDGDHGHGRRARRAQIRASDNSQLYMYVGVKDREPGREGAPAERPRQAARSTSSGRRTRTGTASTRSRTARSQGEWVAHPDAGEHDEPQLEAASDAVGAMVFARPEDGAFNPKKRRRVLLRHDRRHADARRGHRQRARAPVLARAEPERSRRRTRRCPSSTTRTRSSPRAATSRSARTTSTSSASTS